MPQRSSSVRQSASAWQGCSSSVSALTTRRRGAAAANSLEPLLREGADDDAEDPALEVARDVLDRLAPAERDVRRRLDHVAAELADRDRERRARAQRRLVEEQRDVPAGERRARAARPACARRLQRRRQIAGRPPARPASGRAPTGTASGASAAAARSAGRHAHVRYSALILTYSALRSHVHMRAAPALPVPRSTRSVDVRALQVLGRLRRALVERPAAGEQLDVADPHARPIEVERPRRRGRRRRRAVPSSDRRRGPPSSRAASWRSPAPPAWPPRRSRRRSPRW